MCVARVLLPSRGYMVKCNQCWQCRYERIEDWAGRCVAEMRTSIGAHFVTLTYAPKGDDDNEEGKRWKSKVSESRDEKLYVRDIQLMIKRYREEGYKLSYLIAGEYGSQTHRAHWHAIIFWQDSEMGIPKIEDVNPKWNKAPPWGRNLNERHWAHGFSLWEPLTYDRARYALKYMLKDVQGDARTGSRVRLPMVYSTKPAIGIRYLEGLYANMAQEGLPLKWTYSLKVDRPEKSEHREFGVYDRTREKCYTAYCEAWEAIHGPGSIKNAPPSEELRRWLDKEVFRNPEERWRRLRNDLAQKRRDMNVARATRGLYVPKGRLPPAPDWGPEFVSVMKFREHIGWTIEFKVIGHPLILATYHFDRSTNEWVEGEAVTELELKSGAKTGPRMGSTRETYVEHRLRMLRAGSKKSAKGSTDTRKRLNK